MILGRTYATKTESRRIIIWFRKNLAFHAPVAQLDRALVSGTKGQGFESLRAHHHGEVQEWLNWTVSKTVVRATVPWVRIPPSPPDLCRETFRGKDLEEST